MMQLWVNLNDASTRVIQYHQVASKGAILCTNIPSLILAMVAKTIQVKWIIDYTKACGCISHSRKIRSLCQSKYRKYMQLLEYKYHRIRYIKMVKNVSKWQMATRISMFTPSISTCTLPRKSTLNNHPWKS